MKIIVARSGTERGETSNLRLSRERKDYMTRACRKRDCLINDLSPDLRGITHRERKIFLRYFAGAC